MEHGKSGEDFPAPDWRDYVPSFDRTAIINNYVMLRSVGYGHDDSTQILRDGYYEELKPGPIFANYTYFVIAIEAICGSYSESTVADWDQDQTREVPQT